MDSGTECAPEPGAPPSRPGVAKAGNVSLPEVETLHNSREFRRVLHEGIRRRRGGIVVVRSPGRDDRARFGLVVSKGSGNAVVRNRIKRRLRHAVAGLRLEPGYDYVIIASREVADIPFPRLVRWLSDAMEMGDER